LPYERRREVCEVCEVFDELAHITGGAKTTFRVQREGAAHLTGYGYRVSRIVSEQDDPLHSRRTISNRHIYLLFSFSEGKENPDDKTQSKRID
jgi:hypothetical protein